jgi:CheY-like chemotaxis protein
LSDERPRILVADDQEDVLAALRLLLEREGYVIEQAASPPAVLAAIERTDFDVALVDLDYSRDHHLGSRGARSALRASFARRHPPSGGHDGVE